ncbi:MAG TPA: methyl-accepting chemotaxis protein [Oscillospiraceae bacterium]|nr:methyl-accepting chemotaxis protein [Oscillospiraceae bacterium]
MFKKFNHLKIKTKLLIGFLLITIICTTSSIIGLIDVLDSTTQNAPAASQTVAQTSSTTAQQHKKPIDHPEYFMVSILAVSFTLSVVIAIGISNGISKPMAEMTDAAERIAEGDLNVQINVNSQDEIGKLGAALSKSNSSVKAYITDISENLGNIAKGDLNLASSIEYKGDFKALRDSLHDISVSLNETLTEIRQASEQVSNGSDQVSGGAQALAQGATQQASSVQELSATITEISENVKQNAEYATDASQRVNHVSSELEASNTQMKDMLSAMSKISSSSNEIGKIIKTIEDIAFQTNILALNAAVEAARAGEAGKGFAVVADEVRNLASKSASAAKDTTSLIQNSIAEVANGTKIADTTANALLKVVDNAKAVANTVDQIAKTSNQQANSINQVTFGVEQISAVVQTNSATAEESAAASEELSGQAETLRTLVERFKLRKKSNSQISSQPKHVQAVEPQEEEPEFTQPQSAQPQPEQLQPEQSYAVFDRYSDKY